MVEKRLAGEKNPPDNDVRVKFGKANNRVWIQWQIRRLRTTTYTTNVIDRFHSVLRKNCGTAFSNPTLYLGLIISLTLFHILAWSHSGKLFEFTIKVGIVMKARSAAYFCEMITPAANAFFCIFYFISQTKFGECHAEMLLEQSRKICLPRILRPRRGRHILISAKH